MGFFPYQLVTQGPSAQGPLGPIGTYVASSRAGPVKDGDDEEDKGDGDPDEICITLARFTQHVNDHVRFDPQKVIGNGRRSRIWGPESRGRGWGTIIHATDRTVESHSQKKTAPVD